MYLRKLLLLIVLLSLTIAPLFAGDNKWTAIGPYGGQFFNFAFHPANPAMIFASGYRSTDTGSTWQPMDFQGRMLRISAKSPYTIYSIDLNLSGIYKSENAGVTWKKITKIDFAPDLDEFDFELHPSNPKILYIVETEFETGGHFFKSTDGGQTWVEKKTNLDAKKIFAQLEVDPQNGTLYLLADRGTYVSKNGGESWEFRKRSFQVHTWSNSKLVLDRIRPNILYLTESGDLFRSNNAAQSWNSMNHSAGTTDISVGSDGVLYVADNDHVFRSINNGASFELLPTLHLPAAKIDGIAVHPLRPNIVFVSALIDGIQRSTNSGTSWQVSNHGVTQVAIQDFDISTDGINFLAATNYDFRNYVLVSKNNGKNWNLINKKALQALIHPQDSNLFVLQNENIILSKDGGITWRQIYSPNERSAYLIALDPNNPNVIYAALEFHNERTDDPLGLIKTTNQGKNWQKINTGLDSLGVRSLIVSTFNSNLLFVVSSGNIYKSVNGGLNWQKLNTGAIGPRFITGDPAERDRFYAVADNGLFATTNAGESWESKPFQGIKEPISKIVVNRFQPSTLYAQGSVTYVSSDRGDSWSLFDLRGLPGSGNLHQSPRDANVFYASTSLGIFSYERTVVSGGPIIEQVFPNPVKPGAMITILGRNFGAPGTIMLGKKNLQPSSWTSNKIELVLASDARTAQILVTTNSKKSNQPEVLVLPPDSNNVYPSNGPASGGTRVLIRPSTPLFFLYGKTLLFGRTVARNALELRLLPNTDDEILILCTSPPGSDQVGVNDGIDSFGTFQYQ